MTRVSHAPVDRLVRVDVRKRTLATDVGTPDPSASPITVWYSDHRGGEAIDATLQKAAGAIAGQDGCFQAAFLGSEFLPFWPQRDARIVWRCVKIGTHLVEATPFTVVQTL